jgi:CxxC motif-containing protein
MKIINSTVIEGSVKIGDVLISDILGTGVDVVATSNK